MKGQKTNLILLVVIFGSLSTLTMLARRSLGNAGDGGRYHVRVHSTPIHDVHITVVDPDSEGFPKDYDDSNTNFHLLYNDGSAIEYGVRLIAPYYSNGMYFQYWEGDGDPDYRSMSVWNESEDMTVTAVYGTTHWSAAGDFSHELKDGTVDIKNKTIQCVYLSDSLGSYGYTNTVSDKDTHVINGTPQTPATDGTREALILSVDPAIEGAGTYWVSSFYSDDNLAPDQTTDLGSNDGQDCVTATALLIKGRLKVNVEGVDDILGERYIYITEEVPVRFADYPTADLIDVTWSKSGAIDWATGGAPSGSTDKTVTIVGTTWGSGTLSATMRFKRHPWDANSPIESINASATFYVEECTPADACTGYERCGEWHITTYYTLIESSFPPGSTSPITIGGTTFYVRTAFKNKIQDPEGWGRMTAPQFGHYYLGYDSSGWHLADAALSSTGQALDRDVSIATEALILGRHLGFKFDPLNGFAPGNYCRTAVDTGPAIDADEIDFYVGERNETAPLEYKSSSASDVPVSVSD